MLAHGGPPPRRQVHSWLCARRSDRPPLPNTRYLGVFVLASVEPAARLTGAVAGIGRRDLRSPVFLFPDLQFSLWPFKSSLNLQYQVAANDMGDYRYVLAIGFDPDRCRSLPTHDLEGRGEPRLLPFSIGEFHRPLAPQYHAAFRLIEAIGIQVTWIIGYDRSSLGFHGSRLAILHGVGQCVLRRSQLWNQSAACSSHVQQACPGGIVAGFHDN